MASHISMPVTPKEKVRIDNLKVMDSNLCRRHLRFVLAWAEVDVLDRMRGPVFEDARAPEGFKEVEVDGETGTVAWPGGADLAPDTLYERVSSGTWPQSRAAA
jgi:Protein of unknown function (DUF2442)